MPASRFNCDCKKPCCDEKNSAGFGPLLPFQDGHLQIPDDMIDAKGHDKNSAAAPAYRIAEWRHRYHKHVVADKDAEYTILMDSGEKFRRRDLSARSHGST